MSLLACLFPCCYSTAASPPREGISATTHQSRSPITIPISSPSVTALTVTTSPTISARKLSVDSLPDYDYASSSFAVSHAAQSILAPATPLSPIAESPTAKSPATEESPTAKPPTAAPIPMESPILVTEVVEDKTRSILVSTRTQTMQESSAKTSQFLTVPSSNRTSTLTKDDDEVTRSPRSSLAVPGEDFWKVHLATIIDVKRAHLSYADEDLSEKPPSIHRSSSITPTPRTTRSSAPLRPMEDPIPKISHELSNRRISHHSLSSSRGGISMMTSISDPPSEVVLAELPQDQSSAPKRTRKKLSGREIRRQQAYRDSEPTLAQMAGASPSHTPRTHRYSISETVMANRDSEPTPTHMTGPGPSHTPRTHRHSRKETVLDI